MPRPSEVSKRFRELYEADPEAATRYFYKLSQDSDYIRRYRVCKDMKWVADTEYGALDVTVNLSKPEKDPRAIAAARQAKQSGYPKCLLCVENVGYAGRADHPARDNHRIISQPWAERSSASSILPMCIIMSTASCSIRSMCP